MVKSDWVRINQETGLTRDLKRALSFIDLMRDDLRDMKRYLYECLEDYDENDGEIIDKNENELRVALEAIERKDYTAIKDQFEILIALQEI